MCVYIFCVAIRIHTLLYTYVCMNIDVYIFYVAIYTRMLMYTHCVYILCVAIRIRTLFYTYICMNIGVYIFYVALYIRMLYVYIYICMYVCILVYTYVMWPYMLLYLCCVFPVVVSVIVYMGNLAQVSDARNTTNLLTTSQTNIGVHTYYSHTHNYRSLLQKSPIKETILGYTHIIQTNIDLLLHTYCGIPHI